MAEINLVGRDQMSSQCTIEFITRQNFTIIFSCKKSPVLILHFLQLFWEMREGKKREKKRFLEFGHSVKCQYFPAIFGAFFLSKDMTFEPYLWVCVWLSVSRPVKDLILILAKKINHQFEELLLCPTCIRLYSIVGVIEKSQENW